MHSGRGVTEHASGRSRRRAAAQGDDAVGDNPFALLGLTARPGLSDDDVRAAWRRVAAATHPDREDGGDPARFGAAAAAYVVLRTGFGRGEELADLGLGAAADHRGRHEHRPRRSANPAASGAGRHRARRGAPVDRPTGARLPGLTRRLSWITRRAAAHDPPDAPKQGPAGGAAPMSAGGTAHGPGEGTTWAPGQGTARVSGEGTARVPGEGTARVPREGTARVPREGTARVPREGTARVSGGWTARVSGGWTASWRSVTLRWAMWRLRWRPAMWRPGGLLVRAAGAAAVCVVAVVISGWSPGVVGILAGVLSWVLATAGRALRRRRSQ
jgi:hypothetical protein